MGSRAGSTRPFGTRARRALPAALVALVAFLPFLRGALSGASLYFRDLGQQFFPLRLFALEGLRKGEVRLWNPLVHEGIPLSLPALGYPLDLLQVLRPDDAFLSLTLALHVPLAALAFLAMARGLGLPAAAAAGGAIVFALGGFLLSTVNLYVYVQAAAWAPLLVLGLAREAPPGDRRSLVLTAAALAMGLSTTGVEVVAQAVAIGLVLGWRRWSRTGRRPQGGRPRGRGRARPGPGGPGAPAGREPGRGQRPREGLAHRRGPGALPPPVHPRAGRRRGALRKPREHRERVVGAELLSPRLPLRPEPLPRRDRSRPGRGRRLLGPADEPRPRRPRRRGPRRLAWAMGGCRPPPRRRPGCCASSASRRRRSSPSTSRSRCSRHSVSPLCSRKARAATGAGSPRGREPPARSSSSRWPCPRSCRGRSPASARASSPRGSTPRRARG